MKLFLTAFITVCSMQAFSADLELKGNTAKSLYQALPSNLAANHPGAVVKIAREVSCRAMAAGPGQSRFKCSLLNSRLEEIKLSSTDQQRIFKSLPIEGVSKPGAINKFASEVKCSAMASGPGSTKYSCTLDF